MTSAHFDDFAPVLDNPTDEFSPVMAGAGRWAVIIEDGGQLMGVLWTDDRDALGIVGTEFADPDYLTAGQGEIRRAKSNGYTATEVFDEMVRVYDPQTSGWGDLGELRDNL